MALQAPNSTRVGATGYGALWGGISRAWPFDNPLRYDLLVTRFEGVEAAEVSATLPGLFGCDQYMVAKVDVVGSPCKWRIA